MTYICKSHQLYSNIFGRSTLQSFTQYSFMGRKFPTLLTFTVLALITYWHSGHEQAPSQPTSPHRLQFEQTFTEQKCLKQTQGYNSVLCASCLKLKDLKQMPLNGHVDDARVFNGLAGQSQSLTQASLLAVKNPIDFSCEEYLQFVDYEKLSQLQESYNTLHRIEAIELESSSELEGILKILSAEYIQKYSPKEIGSPKPGESFRVPSDASEIVLFEFSQGASHQGSSNNPPKINYLVSSGGVAPSSQSAQSSKTSEEIVEPCRSILKFTVIVTLVSMLVILKCKEDNPRVDQDASRSCNAPCVDEFAQDIPLMSNFLVLALYALEFIRLYFVPELQKWHLIEDLSFVLYSGTCNVFFSICLLKLFRGSFYAFWKATLVSFVYSGILLLEHLNIYRESQIGQKINLELLFWVAFGVGYLILWRKCLSDADRLPFQTQVTNYFVCICALKVVTEVEYDPQYTVVVEVARFGVLMVCSYVMVFLVNEIPDLKVQVFSEFKQTKGISLQGYENELEEAEAD